jgi:D-sedoheptulose 7-phosphate isomerase
METPKQNEDADSTARTLTLFFDEDMYSSLEEAIMGMQTIKSQIPELSLMAQQITLHLKMGHKVLICGNGGSASQAQHFAAELVGRYKKDREALPGIALCADGSILTCIVNDFGADAIFARQIEALGGKDDILIALSTSGNSPNIVRALEKGNELEMVTCALLGRDGGACKGLADYEIIVARDATARIQETHLFCIHTICDVIERAYT